MSTPKQLWVSLAVVLATVAVTCPDTRSIVRPLVTKQTNAQKQNQTSKCNG